MAHDELRNPSATVDEDQDFDASLREFMGDDGPTPDPEPPPDDFEDV